MGSGENQRRVYGGEWERGVGCNKGEGKKLEIRRWVRNWGSKNAKERMVGSHDSVTQKLVGNMASEERGITRPLILRYKNWENGESIKKLWSGRGIDVSKFVT